MELIYFAVGSVSFYLFWTFIWRRTIRGYYRDKLFDLRDDLRVWTIGHGYSLENKQYLANRNYLNYTLKYLEEYTTIGMLAVTSVSSRHGGAVKQIQQAVDRSINSDDTRFNKKIKNLRDETFRIVTAFMVLRSFPMCFAVVVFLFVNVIKVFYKRIKANSWRQPVREILAHALTTSILVVGLNAPGQFKQIPRQYNTAINMAYNEAA